MVELIAQEPSAKQAPAENNDLIPSSKGSVAADDMRNMCSTLGPVIKSHPSTVESYQEARSKIVLEHIYRIIEKRQSQPQQSM